MRLQPLALISTSVLTVVAAPALVADPGALDRYDCHNDAETGEYHCHGDSALASLGGIAVGAGMRSSVWWYQDEGTTNVFVGPSIDLEAGRGAFALQGGYHYKTLINGDTDIDLAGWDLGVKVGPGVTRYGSKYYLTSGYFFESLRRPGRENAGISGFYFGLGAGYNWDKLGVDVQLDWNNNAGYEDYWEKQGNPADMQTISLRTFLTYRF